MDWMTLSGYRLPPGTHAGAVAAAVAANAANASAAAAAAATTAACATKPELNRSNSAMSDHGNGGGGGGSGGGGGGPQPPPETPSPELWNGGGGGIGSAGTIRPRFKVAMSRKAFVRKDITKFYESNIHFCRAENRRELGRQPEQERVIDRARIVGLGRNLLSRIH